MFIPGLVVQIILTSLLAVILSTGIIVILSSLGLTSANLHERLLSRKNIAFGSLLFLIPVLFSLPEIGLSPKILAAYGKELLISSTIVFSFSITWKVISIVRSFTNTFSLNEALRALDRGEISRDTAKEVQVLESLKKLIYQESDIGWYELQEDMHSGNYKLQNPSVRLKLNQALQQARRKMNSTDERTTKFRVVRGAESQLAPAYAIQRPDGELLIRVGRKSHVLNLHKFTP
jgi:hypothetical protein